MKQFDLYAIGGAALFAIVVEGVAIAQAPSGDAKALAAFKPVPMHTYLAAFAVKPKVVPAHRRKHPKRHGRHKHASKHSTKHAKTTS
jgi:hypothetical protein